MKTLLLALTLFLYSCGGGCGIGSTGCGGGETQTLLPPSVSEVQWQLAGQTPGARGNYAAMVHDGSVLRVFSNFNGGTLLNLFDDGLLTEAKMYEWRGDWSGVSNARVAVDTPGKFLRTIGVQRGESGKCYGLLRIGEAYGVGGYLPSWFETDNQCENWSVVKLNVWNGISDGFSTLSVDESAPSLLDTVNPRNNRFTAVGESLGPRLSLAYSNNGIDWQYEKVELLPAELNAAALAFVSEVKTPFGYHLIAADWNGQEAYRHLHLYSCDGKKYRVLDTASPTFNGPKGTALLYEKSTGLVHSLTNGKHLTFQAAQLPCVKN